MDTEKLREEFENKRANGDFGFYSAKTTVDFKKFTDWWLSKLLQREKEVVEELRKRLLPNGWDENNPHSKILSEIDHHLSTINNKDK